MDELAEGKEGRAEGIHEEQLCAKGNLQQTWAGVIGLLAVKLGVYGIDACRLGLGDECS